MITAVMLNGRRLPRTGGIKGDIIYLGSEFCPNLVPSPAAFGRARRLFRREVVLVTPICSDAALKAAEAVIKAHSSPSSALEVVANDLGLAALCAGRYGAAVRLTAGRVLLRAMAGWPDGYLRGFLAANGITRAETDSPEMLRRWLALGLRASYHVPGAFAAVTRFCPWEERWVDAKCRFSCLGRGRRLAGGALPAQLTLRDCGYSVPNAASLKGCRADRLVYRPEGF